MGSWVFHNFLMDFSLNCNIGSVWYYSATRLTVTTQQTFLQVSQSDCTVVIDGHASLQSFKNIIYTQTGIRETFTVKTALVFLSRVNK